MDVPGDTSCTAREILDRIGGRWSVHLLVALDPGPAHYTGLLRRVDGISRRMLTRTLRELERDGLVTRTEFATVPVTVEYSLTATARELTGPLRAIADWADRNRDVVRAARECYDATRAVRGRPERVDVPAVAPPRARVTGGAPPS